MSGTGTASAPGGGTPDPFEAMDDLQVLAVARNALRRAEGLPGRSATRQLQWQVFDSAMGELARRAMAYTLWKIHERERGE